MKYLLEGARFAYLDRYYEGESPYEPGVKYRVQGTGCWQGTEKVEERFIFEICDEFRRFRYENKDWKETHSVYLGYHLTEKPMTWAEADERYTAIVMGAPMDSHIYHAHSDLTGYLWTTVHITDDEGHDIYKEIVDQLGGKYECHEKELYITLMFEVAPKLAA